MGATLFVKPAHVVAQPMLAPVAWGSSAHGGDTTFNNDEDMTGVVKVSCGNGACAGLKPDGSVVSWGNADKGGNSQAFVGANFTQVCCDVYACSGLKIDGSAVAWGDGGSGGERSRDWCRTGCRRGGW